jgi:hypothetical protein
MYCDQGILIFLTMLSHETSLIIFKQEVLIENIDTQFLLQDYLEINGFFIHLFLLSDIYFLFVIYQVVNANRAGNQTQIVESEKVK